MPKKYLGTVVFIDNNTKIVETDKGIKVHLGMITPENGNPVVWDDDLRKCVVVSEEELTSLKNEEGLNDLIAEAKRLNVVFDEPTTYEILFPLVEEQKKKNELISKAQELGIQVSLTDTSDDIKNKIKEVEESMTPSKSPKRIELETKAKELGIEFSDNTKNKDLEALIKQAEATDE